MTESAAQATMARETRVHYGSVPLDHFGFEVEPGMSHLIGDAYILRTPGGLRYLYRRGHGICIDLDQADDASEEQLWLNGSVYSAVACINGLAPIHASAVTCAGQVFAFTGASGAGKSTLVAALAEAGLDLFCDDTLVLDLSDPAQIVCLPGHKRLKLTEEALALTGASRQEPVSATIPKSYARPAAIYTGKALPLAHLLFLDEGPDPLIEPLSGGAAMARLQDDHYTGQLFAIARQLDRASLFAHMARLVGQVEMASFARPRDTGRFGESVALALEYVTRQAHEQKG